MTAWTDGRTAPHRYTHRRVTYRGSWMGYRPDDPCDTCGGSILDRQHFLAPTRPHRLPRGRNVATTPLGATMEYELS